MCDDQFLNCMVGKPRLHRDLDRGQQLAGSRAERGESEDTVVLPYQCLELAMRFAGRARAKDRRGGKLREPVAGAPPFGVDLVQSHARQLGFDKKTEGYLPSRGAALPS